MLLFKMRKSGDWRNILAAAAALFALLVVEVFVAVQPAAAQSGPVRQIIVEGNRRVEPETVRTYLKFGVGDAYDPSRVNASIKSLFGTGLFSDVQIDRDGPNVIVRVAENPVINQVAFEGNKEVDKATLENEVQLKPRAVFTRAKVQSDVQRILDVYRRQGRFAATVSPKLIELDSNRVNVVFEIDEGGATKVKSINFIGNKAFSDSQLRDIITTSQSGLFDFLKSTNVYDPDRLSLDRELLRQYYLKNGYADIRIVSAGAELDRDGSGFFITFVVDEGEIYSFGRVEIESLLSSVDPQPLYGEMLTKPGALYNQSQMDKTVERLTLVVAEKGFAFSRVRPKASRDAASRTINVTYTIDEGPRVYIERINVSGNARTRDYVVRREFRLAEGDAFNPLMVDKAKKRLQDLGFFKAVDIKRRPGSAPDRVVLDVDLTEQSTGELSFGAGFSTAEGVIGDVSITERNLLGKGQFLRLKVSGSASRMQADLSFTEPRFLDRNISAGFDLFHKTTFVTSYQQFSSGTTGGSLRLGFPIAEDLWLTHSYTLSHNSLQDVQPTASRAIKEAEGDYITSSYGMVVAYDKRNHPRNPNSGYYLQGGAEVAGLGGDVNFFRFSGEARYYYPITEKITFVTRATAGYIEGWGGKDVRLLDQFYRGGETIRGFGRAGLGPRDLNTGDALGGSTFWATNTEVRMPIPFVSEEVGMSWAAFLDAGSLYGASAGAKKNPGCISGSTDFICLSDSSSVRVTAGVSLLWNSPLGPLRLDVGKALVKESFDQEQLVRFGASTKF